MWKTLFVTHISALVLVLQLADTLARPRGCITGVPDVDAAPKPSNISERGTFYIQAYYTSDERKFSLKNVKCPSFHASREGGGIFGPIGYYTVHRTHYNATKSEWDNKSYYYVADPFDFRNYVQVESHSNLRPFVGRFIAIKNDYWIDYNCFLHIDNVVGHCGYWWELFSRNASLSESVFDEAINFIRDSGLNVTDSVRFDNRNCTNVQYYT